MVKIKFFGFNSFDEFMNYFFDTLLPTNQTYDYFIDWRKVRENVLKYVKEISLLSSLSKVSREEREFLLRDLLSKYPEIIPVIPLIIAVREQEITVLELSDEVLTYNTYIFKKRKLSSEEIELMVDFCRKIGIIDLFDEINDLYAYLLGVEVGLDSNARKNRSGRIYEDMVDFIIRDVVRQLRLNVSIKRNKRLFGKVVDFTIYANNKPRIAIECNFYNVSGSKPLEIVRSYLNLNERLKEHNIAFIWITDGPAWRLMKEPLMDAAKELDFILNTKMARKYLGKLFEVILTGQA